MRTLLNYFFLAATFVIGVFLFVGEENLRAGIPAELVDRTRNFSLGIAAAMSRADAPGPASADQGTPSSPSEVRVSDYAPERDEVRREHLQERYSAACDGKGTAVVIGDVVTLRVFERGRVPTGPDEADVDLVAFERLDLGATTEVGLEGTASLPMLGRVPLIDRSLACAEADLAMRLFDLMGIDSVVTIGFASRPPVLIDGPVAQPGRYPLSPGMTVGRLITESGHLLAEATSQATELASLLDRREELSVVESALALEQARHETILTGQTQIRVDADTARALGGSAVETENRLVAASRAEDAARDALDTRRSEDLAGRIEALRDTLEMAERERDYLRARRDRLGGLLNSGAVTSEKHEQAMVALLAAERVVLERRDTLAAAEDELARSVLEADIARSAGRKGRLGLARNAAVELSRVRAQLRQVETRIYELRGAKGIFDYTIERPTPLGPLAIPAVESTPLQPGDLLRVEPAEERAESLAPGASDGPPAGRGDNG